MPRRCIFEWRVVRLRPSRAAAPLGPAMTPPESLNARRIASRSAWLNVVAAGAQASSVDYGASVSVFGEKTAQHAQHVLTTSHGVIKCNQSLFEGTVTASGVEEVTITATYTGCTCFGLACTIDMNGCKYNVSGAGQPAKTALVQVTGCTTGKQIEATVLGCVVTMPEQTVGGHIVFTQNPEDVTANVTASGITYQSHGCPFHEIPTTETSNGTYTGQATFQARQDQGSVHATHNGHTYNKLNQTGTLVTLQAT